MESLNVDIVVLPDWQPFPDQQSLLLASSRIAPVQVCLFVRGSSCGAADVDYYLLPTDLNSAYESSTSTTSGTDNNSQSSRLVQSYREQVVRVDWPLLTAQAIKDVAAMAEDEASQGDREFPFPPHELEGPIFFEGQAVAMLAVDPSHVHPLMDQTLFGLLQSCQHLTIVLVIPASFLAHSNANYRMSWGRRLVRRLWAGDNTLANRIRLLPDVVDSRRMLELLRLADVALDTFPIGSSMQTLALALSVGTPVVALANGLSLPPSRNDIKDITSVVATSAVEAGRMLLEQWGPSVSPLAGFYSRANLTELVADSLASFVAITKRVVTDREYGYGLRVRLLELLDAPGVEGDGLSDLSALFERLGAHRANARRNTMY
jgi:hypothetical protein